MQRFVVGEAGVLELSNHFQKCCNYLRGIHKITYAKLRFRPNTPTLSQGGGK